MPTAPVNHIVFASGAVVAVSVIAVAAVVAIFESPEVRRYTEDVRRRIAVAFNPSANVQDRNAHREPRFNRPEDAEGFFESRSGEGAEPGVDADEETRKRQREELMYWNSVRLQKQREEEAKRNLEKSDRTPGSTFDDFLKRDESAESGAYVFNTGTDLRNGDSSLRHRGEPSATRNFGSAAVYANPFADENHIFHSDFETASATDDFMVPPIKDESMSDIYSATTRDDEQAIVPLAETLIDISPDPVPAAPVASRSVEPSVTVDHEYEIEDLNPSPQEHHQEAYASIQAWAQDSSRNLYSPLPIAPAGPMSEPEMVSDGEMTPTDSISLVGSGEDLEGYAVSARDSDAEHRDDVISESEGMLTPASWSEVGSVISENEGPLHA